MLLWTQTHNLSVLIPNLTPCMYPPLGHVGVHDGFGRNLPGAVHPAAREALEVKLAADFWVGSTGVWHVIAVEWHHVAEHVRTRPLVCHHGNRKVEQGRLILVIVPCPILSHTLVARDMNS